MVGSLIVSIASENHSNSNFGLFDFHLRIGQVHYDFSLVTLSTLTFNHLSIELWNLSSFVFAFS